MNTIQPQYKNTDDFQSYIDNEFRSVLNVLHMNLQNPDLLKEAAARALGWGTYGELNFWQVRENNIKNGIHLMQRKNDYRQRDGWTIIAGNIVAVVSPEDKAILIKALGAGQEHLRVTLDNADGVINLGPYCQYTKNAWLLALENAQKAMPSSIDKECAIVDLPITQNEDFERLFLSVRRTYEGLILDLWYENERESDILSSSAVGFPDNDRFEDKHLAVQLFRPKGPENHPSLDGEHYRWMRIAESTDLNDDECLRIFAIAPEEEHDPSEVIFAERNQAIEYIKQDDQLSEELSDNDGNIVLCKITTSVVSHRQ
ncbi:hypothetical protein CMK12_16380 [Candidatus Poribacteria bacterium]|nr:hypothetical protein [Candidatus Poribacteria bacterium]